jgi:biopolymer transport protein ExbD
VDVVFLLLIFFVLTTTFVESPGIKIDLPRSKTREFVEKRDDIVVILDKEGKLIVNGVSMEMKDLERVFQRTHKKNPSAMVIIKADKEASHGDVVIIMDTAKTSGLNRIAIATEPEPRRREE